MSTVVLFIIKSSVLIKLLVGPRVINYYHSGDSVPSFPANDSSPVKFTGLC